MKKVPYPSKQLSSRDRNIMRRVIGLAELSECPQRHAALIYKSGRVLSVGVNVYRNDPRLCEWGEDLDGISVHAEEAAIRQCSPENLEGATIYVARRGRCREHGLSHPCPRCMEQIAAAGIKRVVYTV